MARGRCGANSNRLGLMKMSLLRWCFAVLALAVVVYLPRQAAAQNLAEGTAPAWIQLEALPDLTTAEERARAYNTSFANVAGFRLGTKWYLLTLGPFPATEAAGRLAALKAAGQIPRDAFITDGADHGAQFWPVGAAMAPLQAGPVAPASDEATAAAAPPPSDETLAEAKASEAQLSRDERAQLQAGLKWYGFYDGALDGAFGPGTRASMGAWQTALGYDATGVLTNLQRATLLANYRSEEASFGFAPTIEPESGIEFALPTALLAFDRYEPPFVHYTAKDGSALRLLLISEPGDGDTLAGLYDLLQTLDAVPSTGARSLDGNSFTLNGASDAGSAFATARASKGAIKGYLLVWQPDQADIAQRILAMLDSSFRSTGDQVLDPGLVPLDQTVKAGVLAGMAVKSPLGTASGIYVDAKGLVLTVASAVQGCGKITLDGSLDAEIIAQDNGLNAAILRPLAPAAPLAAATLSTQSPALGSQVFLAGYSLPTGLPAPVLTEGQIKALGGPAGEAGLLTLSASVTPHDIGGPVVDQTGAVLGMILGGELGGKTLPQGISLAQGAASLAPLLVQAGVAATAASPAPPSPDTRSAALSGMTVQIACWP